MALHGHGQDLFHNNIESLLASETTALQIILQMILSVCIQCLEDYRNSSGPIPDVLAPDIS